MIRTIITADKEIISISVPKSFIGKQVEVIISTIKPDTIDSLLMDEPLACFASEKSLAKDWSSPEEDKVWMDLL